MPDLDLAALESRHVINSPRTHDSKGNRIEEPPQCRRCLQSWPCETRQLLDLVGRYKP